MLRVSVLLLAWSFSALFVYQAEGFELPWATKSIDGIPPGSRQSPIEFDMFQMCYRPYDPNYNGLKTTYYPAESRLSAEHGDTLQVTFNGFAGAFIKGVVRYELRQFHFHAPLEHKFKQYPIFCDVNRISNTAKQADRDEDSVTTQLQTNDDFVMEMHLVHTTSDNKIAVIGVLFKLGNPSNFLNKFWGYISKVDNAGIPVGRIDTSDLELGGTFLRYNGSLTTEPYTENVLWTVMCGNWNTISPQQLRMYKKRFPKANNRPLQPRNARRIVLNFPLSMSNSVQPEIQLGGATLVQSS